MQPEECDDAEHFTDAPLPPSDDDDEADAAAAGGRGGARARRQVGARVDLRDDADEEQEEEEEEDDDDAVAGNAAAMAGADAARGAVDAAGAGAGAGAAAAALRAGAGGLGRALRGGYDMGKREPQFSGAERAGVWELSALAAHLHPSVAAMARTLCAGAHVVYAGDPLRDLSLAAFLDRWLQKKPKAAKAAAQQQEGAGARMARQAAGLGATAAQPGSAEFAALVVRAAL